MPPCIQTVDLTKCYGSVVAVGGLSLEVQAGEVVGLLGANGAGKSTTLLMLCGLVPPTSGSVQIFGKDVRRQFLQVAPRIGVLPERPAFFDHLSARQNLLLLAQLSRRDITVDRTLDRVGLLRRAGQKVGTFSLGMRQRLGLAQALLTEPELLLLDEPTSGLDPESTQEILRLLRRLSDEANVTILFSSHMLHEVEILADRVAILSKGRLLSSEDTEKLLAYDTSRIEVLTDSPEAAARRLEEQSWVKEATAAAGRVQVVLEDGTPHQLTQFLISSGFVISGVIPRRRTLQDYYLKVLNS